MAESVQQSELQLDRGLLSDQIYKFVKTMIKDGTLDPGEQIVESGLARRLRVSQAPVREALKRLVHEGLITHVPHQGNFVSQFSREEAEHARIARVALEGTAARIVAGHLGDASRATLTDLISQMHAAADRDAIDEFRELDFLFHRTVVESTRNPYLRRLWDLIEPSLRSMNVLSDPTYTGDWHSMAVTHEALVTALRGGDPDEAEDLFVCHAIGTGSRPVRPSRPVLDKVIEAVRSMEEAAD